MWPASMQIYWHKRKRLHKEGTQFHRISLRHQHGRRDVMWNTLLKDVAVLEEFSFLKLLISKVEIEVESGSIA